MPLPGDGLMSPCRARIRDTLLEAARQGGVQAVDDRSAILGELECMQAFRPPWVESFRRLSPAEKPAEPPPAVVAQVLPSDFLVAYARVLPELLRRSRHHPHADDLVCHVYDTALAAWPKFTHHSDDQTDHWFLVILHHAMGHPLNVHPHWNHVQQAPLDADLGIAPDPTAPRTSGTAQGDRAALRRRVEELHARFPQPFHKSDVLDWLKPLASFELVVLADTLECVLQLPKGSKDSHFFWGAWALARWDEPRACAALDVTANYYGVLQTRLVEKALPLLADLWL
jgi:hypothetical protein